MFTGAGFWAPIAQKGRSLCTGLQTEVDFAHGLHTEGFVHVDVICVAIVLVIVVVLYFCVGYVLCFQIVASAVEY